MNENNATRSALIDALLNPRWLDMPGRDVRYGGEVSPMMTGLPAAQSGLNERGTSDAPPAASPVTAISGGFNQWGQREYDVYDPPPVAPLPFSRQYRSDVSPPADTTGRLTHDPEGRALGAPYIAGLTEVDGLNVGLRPEEVADVTRRLVGRDPARVPMRSGENGRTIHDPPPLRVEIRNNLRPDLRRKVEAHELGHVIDYIAKYIPVEPHRAQLRSVYNTLNNPS